MASLNSSRLAWSVAAASLALWATSAPVTWGAVTSGAARLFNQDTTTTTTTTINLETRDGGTTTMSNGDENVLCLPLPAALGEITPPITIPQQPDVTPPAQQGTFRLCGPDAAVERAIEQLIAGRAFSSRLSSRGDGCAELTLAITSQGPSGSGTSTTSVSLGSGRTLTVQISSENGATRASIGAGN